MIKVAQEMQRTGMDIPLLIRGATTSKAHTAAKIAPAYQNRATVYVSDASRAIGVAAKLLADDRAYEKYASEVADEYAMIKHRVETRREKRAFLSLESARANPQICNRSEYIPPAPNKPEIQTIEPKLEELIP